MAYNLDMSLEQAVMVGAVAGAIESGGSTGVFGASSFKLMPRFVVETMRKLYPKRVSNELFTLTIERTNE